MIDELNRPESFNPADGRLWGIGGLDSPQSFLHLAMQRPRAHQPEGRVSSGDTQGGPRYAVLAGGIAMIGLQGLLSKSGWSWSGVDSTIVARQRIRAAAADPAVKSILMVIDSPGGTIAGTAELARDIANAATAKPLVAYCEDLAASAAYWIASAARRIYANATALVGSIGTFMVVGDYSAAAEKQGLKVHVLRAGKFKGAGTPGTEISKEQLAEWQRVVDALNEHFLSGVSFGRKLPLSRVQELADGRVHLAADAARLGLIDGIRTFDEVLAELRGKPQGTNQTPPPTGQALSGQQNTAAGPPATFHQLAAAYPEASNKTLRRWVSQQKSLAEASEEYALIQEVAQQKAEEGSAENRRIVEQMRAQGNGYHFGQ